MFKIWIQFVWDSQEQNSAKWNSDFYCPLSEWRYTPLWYDFWQNNGVGRFQIHECLKSLGPHPNRDRHQLGKKHADSTYLHTQAEMNHGIPQCVEKNVHPKRGWMRKIIG